MIFVDSNVPMYLVGAAHPHKLDAQRLFERCLGERIPLVTNAEVLQEILHRYVAINRREAIAPAFDLLLEVVDEVFPVLPADVERARDLVLESGSQLSARDALHLAVMEHHAVLRIMSFDSHFDGLPGIERLPGR